jgi:anti-anti-sigma factor
MPESATPASGSLRRSRRASRPGHGPAQLIAPWAALDLLAAEALEREILLAAARRPERLRLDLSRVEFMDCCGLRALINARDQLRARGTRLVLHSVQAQPRRLLDLVEMADAFELVVD